MRTLPASRPLRGANFAWVIRTTAIVLILGVLVAYAVLAVATIAANWYFYDAEGYWEAGMRLRSGGELYPPLADQDHPSVYRYAPWFAWIWAGLTFLPRESVLIAWGVLMAAASLWLLWQLPRSVTGAVLALIFAPMLLRVVSQGNIQPLMVAGLAWGVMRRSGPVWVATAASIKMVPILFAALYLARREYERAALSAAITALLWLPVVAYGIEHYPTGMGGEAFPFGPATFAIAAAAVVAVFLAPGRYRIVAATIAVTFASPRWIPYNPTYLLCGTPRHRRPSPPEAGTDYAPSFGNAAGT